jgi:hypothetical protein
MECYTLSPEELENLASYLEEVSLEEGDHLVSLTKAEIDFILESINLNHG